MFWSCCIVFGQNPSCSVTDSGKLPYLDKPAGPIWQMVNPKQPSNSEGQYYNLAGKRSNPVFSPACICGLLAALLTACAVQIDGLCCAESKKQWLTHLDHHQLYLK
jgi:hypothetical protein